MLAPRPEICSRTAAVAPLPSVTIVTTAATPMTMPSMVRNERSRWRRISRIASTTVVTEEHASGRLRRGAVDQAVRTWTMVWAYAAMSRFVRDHQDGDAAFG